MVSDSWQNHKIVIMKHFARSCALVQLAAESIIKYWRTEHINLCCGFNITHPRALTLCVCLHEECPAETHWRQMKAWWWCRSWRTDSRNTLINWSMCACLPWTWEMLCRGIMTTCSSVSLNIWSGSHRWPIAWRRYRWTPLSLCRWMPSHAAFGSKSRGSEALAAGGAVMWPMMLNQSTDGLRSAPDATVTRRLRCRVRGRNAPLHSHQECVIVSLRLLLV